MNTLYDPQMPIRNPHVNVPPMRSHPDYPHPSNNLLERLNGTVRERLKVMRGFDGEEGAKATLDAWRTYYNYIRPHQGLDGKTPAEMARIPLSEGKNRWMALIEAFAAMQQGVKKGSNQP